MSIAAPPRPDATPHERRRATRRAVGDEGTRLGGYPGRGLRDREIVSVPAAGESTLVIDRDAITHLDERLVAHLASDEPPANMHLICPRGSPTPWRVLNRTTRPPAVVT